MEVKRKTDRRVIKTKRAIRNAFAKLLSEKDINEITIKNIADEADINRKTFYSYYNGVYEVIDEIENEIITSFNKALLKSAPDNILNDPYEVFENLTSIMNSDLEFYSHLLKMDHNMTLVTKIVDLLKQNIKKSFSELVSLSEEDLGIIVDFSVSGMIKVYQSWFNSDRTQSLEDISKKISVITFSGINGVLNRNK